MSVPRNGFPATLVFQPLAMVSAAMTGVIGRIAACRSVRRPSGSTADVRSARSQSEAAEANVEYLRLVYQSTRGWYTASETKAQVLLAVNGAFVTVLFGALFGRPGNLRVGSGRLGVDTWIFTSVSVVALVSAIVCAALCLWSLHGRVGQEFTRLGVDPANPASYRPEVLWYFGHLALLQPDAAKDKLRDVDLGFEIETLSYHVIDLAHKVLRKHRWVNAGWAFTALALIALVAAETSFFVRAQF